MKKRRRLTFAIALSGVSAALALVGLVLSYYVPVGHLGWLVLTEIALLLPLGIHSTYGCVMAFLAAGALGIAATSPLAVVPYAFIFGLHAVLTGLEQRYLPKAWYIALPVKVGVFNLGLWGTVSLYGVGETITLLLDRLGWDMPYWVLALVGSVLWIAYDLLLKLVRDWVYRRLKPVLVKHDLEPPEPQPKQEDNKDEEDFFDE